MAMIIVSTRLGVVTDDSPGFAVANTAFVAAIVAIVLIRQFTVRPVRASMFVWIVLLLARGILPPGPVRPTATGIGFLAAALVASAVIGVWRGKAVPMWRTDSGQVFRRGDRLTLGLWVLTIAVRLALAVAENHVDHTPFNANALWLGAGVTLGAQQLVMLWHAPRIPVATPLRVP